MKKCTLSFLFLIALTFSLKAQLNQNYESASTLGKKGMNLSSYYSSLQLVCDHSPEYLDKEYIRNFGLRLGYGITNRFDLQLSYSYLSLVDLNHHFCISPKYSIYKNKIAASIPLSFYYGNEGKLFTLSPKIILTQPISQYLDISLIPKMEIAVGGSFERFYSVSIGFGVSKNLQKWAIRPELGLHHKLSSSSAVWSYGLGFQYKFK